MASESILRAEIDDYQQAMGRYDRVATSFNKSLDLAKAGTEHLVQNSGRYYVSKGADSSGGLLMKTAQEHQYQTSDHETGSVSPNINGKTGTLNKIVKGQLTYGQDGQIEASETYVPTTIPVLPDAPDINKYGSEPTFTQSEKRILEGGTPYATAALESKSVLDRIKQAGAQEWSPYANNELGLIGRALAGKL